MLWEIPSITWGFWLSGHLSGSSSANAELPPNSTGRRHQPQNTESVFSAHQVYDAEGDLQWYAMEDALQVSTIYLESGDFSVETLENLWKENIYPIACVSGKHGNLHFVLLVGRTEDENWCMDPMHTEPELVPLSQYGNDIASIRYLIEPSFSESKAAD